MSKVINWLREERSLWYHISSYEGDIEVTGFDDYDTMREYLERFLPGEEYDWDVEHEEWQAQFSVWNPKAPSASKSPQRWWWGEDSAEVGNVREEALKIMLDNITPDVNWWVTYTSWQDSQYEWQMGRLRIKEKGGRST